MALPLKYNVRSLLERKSRTLLAVLGVGAVIAVFVAMVSFAHGLTAGFARRLAREREVAAGLLGRLVMRRRR